MKKKHLQFLVAFAVCLILLTAASVGVVYTFDRRLFYILLVPDVIITAAFVLLITVASRNVLKFITRLEKNVNSVIGTAVEYLPAYTAIVDGSGKLLWYNSIFEQEILYGKDGFGLELRSVIGTGSYTELDELSSLKGTNNGTVFKYGDKHFRLCAKFTQNEGASFYIVTFTDITELVLLQHRFAMKKPSVLLIMIDNYEDLLLNEKESERAEVSVAIQRLLDEFMSPTGGVIRKLAQDRFIAVIEEQHLKPIVTQKFNILDKARSITVGGRNDITLSIGVGHGAKDLLESDGFAKQSLDMALGRGGDQAVVKTETGFNFFGGTSKGVEKKSRGKTRIVAKAMRELILSSEQVFIMGHLFGDFDSVGSAIGLAGAIKALGRQAYVVHDPLKTLAGPLVKMFTKTEDESDSQDVQDSTDESSELFISAEEALAEFTDTSLLIIVDTHSSDFLESKELYETAGNIIIIDHHRKTVNFIGDAAIFHHEPYASSTAEMVTELVQYFFENARLKTPYANALLAGITLDTKNFVMKTGVRTFEAAAMLRKNGADPITVKELFSNSVETLHAKAQFIGSAEILGKCAIVACGEQTGQNTDLDLRLIAPQVADDLLSISGVDASFVIYAYNEGVNISARSLGKINVQVIMEKLGGGGHLNIAAAQLSDCDVNMAKERLTQHLSVR
ncbi:MAG: DHH family phosphoesterase [Oscillospiraceae bacterium]|nr:DHH family phosphoesterase [Oscillospiraceae bacterium]